MGRNAFAHHGNYFNELTNWVSYGARRSIAFLQVIKKIYKREGDVKH
ncbi:hypothetical protein HMPREF9533_05522 [Escherichia coli MS 60-1]|nr:hypothetical protein HMPREF9533_05522 [Escherichia coli MS 60-1]